MAADAASLIPSRTTKSLRVALWIAQAILAILFCSAGFAKLTTPIIQLATMIPWTGDLPVPFVRIIGLIDLAGGIGILLPALTRILPQLGVWAALGCTVLQVLAAGFHISRGEFSVLPVNVVLLLLSIFVLWGRSQRAPISPR
ncbi:MAG: DoxX family protein [Methylovirgula sp.]